MRLEHISHRVIFVLRLLVLNSSFILMTTWYAGFNQHVGWLMLILLLKDSVKDETFIAWINISLYLKESTFHQFEYDINIL